MKKEIILFLVVIVMLFSIMSCGTNPAEIEGMVFVKGGTFRMGSDDGEDSEKPVHFVTVRDIYVGKHQVTVEDFQTFISASGYKTTAEVLGYSWIWTGSKWEPKTRVTWRDDASGNRRGSNENNHPVIHISWYDTIEYCNWLSRKEGLTPVYNIDKNRKDSNNQSSSDDFKWTVTANWNANGYRLPTEAEWEYTARGGRKSKGYKYSGSNNIGDVAWYFDISGEKTNPVGQKQTNELGIYDMTGNVWEWCWDWHGYYSSGAKNNPRGPQSGQFAVLRGGSWGNFVSGCLVSYRIMDDRYISISRNGVRLFRTP